MARDISFNVRNNNGDPLRVSAWRLDGSGEGPTVHLQAGVHADEIAGMLQGAGINALAYHACHDSAVRQQRQDRI